MSEFLSKKPTFLIFLVAFAALIGAGGTYLYFRTHTVNDAEDRRRWLREMDIENEKSGFIKNTNGDMIYVGRTNGHPAPDMKEATK